MAGAIYGYGQAVEQHEWLVDLFVCPAHRVSEAQEAAIEALGQDYDEEEPVLYLSAIGTAVQDAAKASESIAADFAAILEAEEIVAESFEIKLPGSDAVKALVKQAEKSEIEDLQLFVEFPWDKSLAENMQKAAGVDEEIGFKARTGGVTADLFPSVEQLAAFIVEAVSLEAPFKFTAGLHEPIRHYDEAMRVHRHGFLNVLIASAMAESLGLGKSEVEMILAAEDDNAFTVDDEGVGFGNWVVPVDDLYGAEGFGSCCVDEPISGLQRLNLI